MFEHQRPGWADEEPARFLGLSAAAFDLFVFAIIAGVAVAVWVLVFNAWLPEGAETLDPRRVVGLR
jgi:hypothetical protein